MLTGLARAGGRAQDGDSSMYFEDVQQLVDIFSQLEERNVFLIQNVTETEQALEELKHKFEETKVTMCVPHLQPAACCALASRRCC
jgi:hypothetical protein